MKKLKPDLTLDEVQQIIQAPSARTVIQNLVNKGWIELFDHLEEPVKAKTDPFLRIGEKYQTEEQLKQCLQDLEKAPRQANMLLSFLHLHQTQTQVRKSDLLKQVKEGSSALKILLDKQILQQDTSETATLVTVSPDLSKLPELSPSQQKAYTEIKDAHAQKTPVLLHGVTGSGKTHIYFHLIKDCLLKNQQALFLLPEIALTAQMIQRIRQVFGNQAGIYHSRYSDRERMKLWQGILRKEIKIVLGARSSLWLPFQDLSLILVDEEHDASYKQQDPAPRFHTRDSALYLAKLCGADIVLGSATPSVESYYLAQQQKFRKVELSDRFGNVALPTVHLIDLKKDQSKQKQVNPYFSEKLTQAIQESLRKNEQIILFQNRRGYAPFMMCSVCAWVPHCKSCDVSLTYHKYSDQLHCHYCGSKSAAVTLCPACGHTRILARSFGTEKIEDEVRKLFPGARTERFDWDMFRVKNKYQEIIRRLEQRQIDILVGTQMVVKGLDLDHVGTVGIMQADGLMTYPDFRVMERAYQMMEQVSGRAGRKQISGQVYIQTFKPAHPLFACVQQHDYDLFYRDEITARQQFQYPPFTRLIRLLIKHTRQEKTEEAGAWLMQRLQNLQGLLVLGPSDPPVARIRNKYIKEILIKIPREYGHITALKNLIRQCCTDMQLVRGLGSVQVIPDVDPT